MIRLQTTRRMRKSHFSKVSCRRLCEKKEEKLDTFQEQASQQGHKARWGLRLSMFGVGLVSGGVALCYYDKDVRKSFEDTVPYSDKVLEALIGPVDESRSLALPWYSTPKNVNLPLPSTEQSLGPLSESRESSAIETVRHKLGDMFQAKKQQPALPAQTASDEKDLAVTKPKHEIDAEKAVKKVDEKAKITEKLKEEERQKETDNKTLEATLKQHVLVANAVAEAAINAQLVARDCFVQHTKRIHGAMDELDPTKADKLWQAVTNGLQTKGEKLGVAEEKASEALKEIAKLEGSVKKGKEGKHTRSNTVLKSAEKSLADIKYRLSGACGQLSTAQSELNVTEKYKKQADKASVQFKKEIQSIVPEVKIGEKSASLTKEELNLIIAHAHRRVEQLQRQVSEQQTMQATHTQHALNQQKEENKKLTAQAITTELEKQKAELAVEQELALLDAKLEFEKEIREQLKRQAAAHSDHLTDVLNVQYKEQESKLRKQFNMEMEEEQERLENNLTKSLARLRGIEAAVDSRAQAEKDGMNAQELWLAVQAFKSAAKFGKPAAEGADWEERLKPLADEVAAIKMLSAPDDFMNVMLSTVPEVAQQRGVYTEEAILQRFHRVSKLCRRVALIDERGGNLFTYFLSYIQSFFVFEKRVSLDEPIKTENLDTFDILSYAECFLQNGDLEQAARLMNQLRGEPRRVASGWLDEARLLLEVHQLSRILTAHAATTHVASIEQLR